MKKIALNLFLCFLLLVIVICFSFVKETNDYSFLIILSFLLVIETLIILVLNKNKNGSLFNFSTILILALLFFNFSHVFLLAFFQKYLVEKTVVFKYFSYSELNYALKWMNIAYVAFGLGTFLYNGSSSKIEKKCVDINKANFSKWKAVAFALLLTLPLKMFIDINFLYRAIFVGFQQGKQWLNTFPNYLVVIGDFSIIGLAQLLILFRNNRLKKNIVFLLSVLYLLVLMLSGRRSENVAYICILTYIFIVTKPLTQKQRRNSRNNPITTFLKGFVLVTFSFFILTFLYTAVRLRGTLDRDFNMLFTMMKYYLVNENILLEELREFGQTGYTSICVLLNWLPERGPSFGTSYYLGISSVFPNIGGFMGSLTRQSNFGLTMANTPGMLDSRYMNIGGSMIGEAFFNFGTIGGTLVMLILGFLTGIASYRVDYGIKNSKSIVIFIPIMFYSLYWVRDYFCDSIRNMLWGVLVCYLLQNAYNLVHQSKQKTINPRIDANTHSKTINL